MFDEIGASLAKSAEGLSPVFLAVLRWLSARIAQFIDTKFNDENVAR